MRKANSHKPSIMPGRPQALDSGKRCANRRHLLLWFVLCLTLANGRLTSYAEDISPVNAPRSESPGELSEHWVLASQTSALIYVQTENRARTYVEYGGAEPLDRKTAVSPVSQITGQPYWSHFHRLTGLEMAKAYYYRIVCQGTDGEQVVDRIREFRTTRYADAVPVPGDLPGPPFVLDRSNTTYVLTEDVTAPLAGFEIKADGVTLDLGGHTVTYNARPAERPDDWPVRAYRENDHGVKVTVRGGRVRILGGTIGQGAGNNSGTAVGIGCNPVYVGNAAVEMAGVEFVWTGADISGAFFHWNTGNHVHHCIFDDRGTAVSNRHQAISSIDGNSWGDYDHNLVKSTRQQGLQGCVAATRNEIYIDSQATNAFGMVGSSKAGKPVEIANNRIIGIGEHPVGIAMFKQFPPGSSVHHNYVEVKCTRSGQEYGYTGSACFRTTWGADYLDVHDNTFIGHADVYDGKVSKTRVLWVGLPHFTPKDTTQPITDARGIFHDNRIIARGRKGAKAGGICVVCLNQSPNLIFRGNTVTSTWANVLLSDEYGHADGYPKFVENTFLREGEFDNYCTILQQYPRRPATGVFLDNKYGQGAGAEQLKLEEGGRALFQVPITVQVTDAAGQALGDANVTIRDADGNTVCHAETHDAKTAAMLVAERERLLVKHPVDAKHKGFVGTLPLEAGHVRIILTLREVTQAGTRATPAYTLEVRKPGYQTVKRPLEPSEATDVEIKLERSAS